MNEISKIAFLGKGDMDHSGLLTHLEAVNGIEDSRE